MKVAQDQEENKSKLYSEIVMKEAPKPRIIDVKLYNKIVVKEVTKLRTIDAKLYNEFIVKRSLKIKNNRSEVIQRDCSKRAPKPITIDTKV